MRPLESDPRITVYPVKSFRKGEEREGRKLSYKEKRNS